MRHGEEARVSQKPRRVLAFLALLSCVVAAGLTTALAAGPSPRTGDGSSAQASAEHTDGQGIGEPATEAQLQVLREIAPRVARSEEAGRAAEPELSASDVGDPASAEELRQAEREWQRQHPRSSPAEREASETAYEQLDRGAASSLFAEQFPSLLDAAATPEQRLGGEPQRYIGDNAAVIETEQGERMVVVSQGPLSTEEPDGSREPVDLTLAAEGGEFVPRNVEGQEALPKQIEEGLPLATPAAELSFPSADAAGTGQRIGDSEAVFYPDVATDTDLIVKPTASGLQFSLQLRSAKSPERFALPVDLPAGAELSRDAESGGASILMADGSGEISISPLLILDTDGYPLEGSLDVAAEKLILRSPHRAANPAYPLVIDPTVSDVMTFDYGQEEWQWANYPAPGTSSYGNYSASLYGSGLFNVANAGNYVAGQRAIWYYRIPHLYDGTTAYFSTARFNWAFNRGGANANRFWPYLEFGLYSTNGIGYYLNRYAVTHTDGRETYLSTNDASSKMLFFELAGGQGGTVSPPGYGQFPRYSYLYDATAYITDTDVPGVGLYGTDLPASGWIDNNLNYTVSVLGADGGLGVQTIYLKPGGLPTQSVNQKIPNTSQDCIGIRETNKCPNWGGASATFSLGSLGSGVHQITSWARDVAGNQSSSSTSVATARVDRSNPNPPALSGPLAPESSQQGYTLTVQGSDAHSGVRSIELTIDGQPAAPGSATGGDPSDCPNINQGGCGRTLNYTAPLSVSGEHTFRVTVLDQVGRSSSRTWSKSVVHPDTTPPQTTIDSGPNGLISDNTPTFTFSSNEGGSTFQCRTYPSTDPSGAFQSCSSPHTTAQLADGEYTFEVKATDPANNEDASPATRSFSVDATAPNTTIDSGPSGPTNDTTPTFSFSSNEAASTFQCRTYPSTDPSGAFQSCSSPHTTAQLADGEYTFEVKATDPTMNEDPTPAQLSFTVDAAPPDTTITSGPETLTTDPTPTFGFVSDDAEAGFRCRFDVGAFAPCSNPRTHTPSTPLPAGSHTFEVKAVDQAGNEDPSPAERDFTVVSGLVDDFDREKLGLEQFFAYDSTETGLSGAHANLNDGNLVFHAVPMVNPGRGLASVVNVTYNSYERKLGALPDLAPIASNPEAPEGARDLLDLITEIARQGGQGGGALLERLPSSNMLPIGYNTAGPGFSSGLSGVTRINEPLRVPGGVLPLADPSEAQLTDADGTVHTFPLDEAKSDLDPTVGRYVYEQPKGINLQLRTFANGPTAIGQEDNPKTWALTRPEGPTEFYDGWGFLRSIVDRDGNTMRFDYKKVNALTGDPCNIPVTPVLCEPRLERVVDAAGVDGTAPAPARTFTLTYNDYELQGLLDPLGGGTAALAGKIASGTLPVPQADDGLLASITDHAGRKLAFAYDQSTGRLLSTTDNATAAAEERRIWNFSYDSQASGGANQPQLTEVEDPRGESTTFTYWGADPKFAGRQVRSVENRAGNSRDFGQIAGAEGASHTIDYSDARGNPQQAITDAEGRPTTLIDAGGRTTLITYDSDSNVSTMTEAYLTDDEATWGYTWGDNGELESQTDPIGRKTTIGYCVSRGTQIAPVTTGSDANSAFVVDMISIQRPKAASTYLYGLDGGQPGSCPSAPEGHVTSTLRPATGGQDRSSEATYLATGELASETNEAGETTTFSSYNPDGLPQVVVNPRGNAPGGDPNDHRTLYKYNARGDVTGVVDPRGSRGSGPSSFPGVGADFRTTLEYDAFGQLEDEYLPRDTEGGADVFIHRSYAYDPNGNQTDAIDGERELMETEFTPMDRPESVTNAELEKVAYTYDAEEALKTITAPEGVATTGPAHVNDHMTEYRLDPLGRPLAQIQRSTDEPDLITSYAYDNLDNVVGVAMPRDNADANGQPVDIQTAIRRASDSDQQRLFFNYDLASQLKEQTENPDGTCASANQIQTTKFAYDDNGNRDVVFHPRAFCEAAPGPEGMIEAMDRFSTRTEYDTLDRPTRITDSPGSGSAAQITDLGYDPVGRLASEETPRGNATSLPGDHTTTYDYDADGNLTSRSVPYADSQYGVGNGTLSQVEVSYVRDAVGNPISITDPRGLAFANDFYDSGEIKSTERPSWWRLDWRSGAESPSAGKRFSQTGGGIAADLAVPVGGPSLSEGGPISGGSEGGIPSGGLSGDFGATRPEELPDFLPRAGHTEFTYDKEGRLKSVTPVNDVARTSVLDYDGVGRITSKSWPFQTIGPNPTPITHEFTYDLNGNLATYADGVATAGPFPSGLGGRVAGGLDAGDYTTTFDYDQFDRRIEEDAPGSAGADATSLDLIRERTSWAYDPNGNVTSIETPRGAITAQADDFELSYAYDPLDRLETETNGESESFSYLYDAASNPTLITDPLGRRTDLLHDPFDQVTEITEAEGSAVERTTELTLDQEGNVTRSLAPGAAYESGGQTIDRITEMTYDGLGRAWKTTTGSGAPASSNSLRTQIVQRDESGNVVREIGGIGASDPASIGRFDPYASGFPEGASLEAATIHSTLNRYDEDGLRTATFLPHSGNEDHRYRSDFGYDPSGRLDRIDHAYDFTHSPDPSSPSFDPQARTTAVSYSHYGTGWIRTASDERDVAPGVGGAADQAVSYDYDPRGFQTRWTTGGYANGRDSAREITRESYPSGTMFMRHGVKLSATGGPDPSEDSRTYTYFYNPNRSLASMKDRIPSFPDAPSNFDYTRTTTIARDEAERELRINEDFRGGRDTTFAYDDTGNVTLRRTDGELTAAGGGACSGSGAGCTYIGAEATSTAFTYDALDREQTMERASDGETDAWRTDWWPSSELRNRTRIDGSLNPANPASEDSAATDLRYFWPSGDPSARVHDPASSEGPAKQTYSYDPNGNRTLDERGIHAYNARSQLVKWQRAASSGPGSAPAGQSYAELPGPMGATGSTTYALDGTGQTLMRTDSLDYKAKLSTGERPPVHEDTRARYRYENGSLSQVVANTDKNVDFNEVDLDTKTRTVTDFSRYDDLGNVRRIETETTSLTPGTPDPADPPLQPQPSSVPGCAAEIADWSGSNTTFHCFDPFGRLVATRAPKPESQSNPNPTLSYIYDGLDRRDVGLKKQGSESTVTTAERTYVGTSELLSREARPGGGVDARTYAYDSQGLRLGAQVDRGQTSPRFDAYSHDANGSVVGIEDDDTGEIADTDRYLYDPYGALLDTDPGDTQSAEQELSTDAQANPFRFEGFYYDSGIQSYDMQAREYRPDIGAFLSQDRFEAAGADLALQSDPLTQNRYAFAGGNPVSNIEFDGHCPGCTQKESQRTSGADVTSSNADNRRESAAREEAYAGGGCYQGYCPSTGGSPIPGTTVPRPVIVQIIAPPAPSPRAVVTESVQQNAAREGYTNDASAIRISGATYDSETDTYAYKANGVPFGPLDASYVRRGEAYFPTDLPQSGPTGPNPILIGDSPVEIAANFFPYAKLVTALGRFRRGAEVAARGAPTIKPGTAGGPTAGKPFPQSVKDRARAADPTSTCVYCARPGTGSQVDHAIPRAQGGNTLFDNAQLACPFCNASKGARDFPVNPPPDYFGPWPPPHWPRGGS